MRRQHILLLLLLLLPGLASCGPGHVGGNEIAFVRGGHLWTIDPDGANAFEAVSGSDPVIGYAWSPDHHIFVFRTLDSGFAKGAAGKNYPTNPITEVPGDLPSSLNTIGLDGGTPIPIIFASSDISRSNAWWNPGGNRLLFREEPLSNVQNPLAVSWWVSQNDQPAGIARKSLPSTFSIPSVSFNNMAIGNTSLGVFTTTLAGTNLRYLIPGGLRGHPLSATLERVLEQPAHQNPALLYAVTAPSSQSQSFSSKALIVQLMLRGGDGHTSTLATCHCTQFVWSPDSQRIASGASDETVQILDATSGNHLYTYRGHTDVVSSVSWSPDGKHIASGSWDKTVQVWDAVTGDVLYRYSGYNVRAAQLDPTKGVLPDLIFVVAWSHNGKRIAAVTQVYCGDLCAVVLGWDAYTERNFTFYLDSPMFALAWSPDDTRFVTSIDNFVQGPLPQAAPQEGPFVQISEA